MENSDTAIISLASLEGFANAPRRKLQAAKAVEAFDAEGLLKLTQAYIALRGKKRSQTSERTLTMYRVGIRDFLMWLKPDEKPPKASLVNLSVDEVSLWLVALETTGSHLKPNGTPLAPTTCATYLAGVRALFAALAWSGLRDVIGPIASPVDPRPAHTRNPVMPEHLYRMLLEGLSPAKPVDLRDRIAIRLMGDCGLRVAEVVSLEVDSVDLTSRRIWVMGKGRKPREVPIPRGLSEELKLWLKLRRVKVLPGRKTLLVNMGGRKAGGEAMTADHLRVLVNQRFQDLAARLENPAEMKYSGCHVLRKVAGTAVYRSTNDLGKTGKLLGHSNLNTTAIYAQADLGDIGSVMDLIEEGRGQ